MASSSRLYKLFSLGVAGSAAAVGITQVMPSPPISVERDRKLRRLGLQVTPDVPDRSPAPEPKPVSATVNLLLVQHGQNVALPAPEEADQSALTPTGRNQVSDAGRRIVDLDYPYTWVNTCIYNSPVKRDQDTANIITGYLPEVRMEHDELLHHEHPASAEPETQIALSAEDTLEDDPRMEAAFRKYVKRARADQVGDSYKVIVCNQKVINYMINRALQDDSSSQEDTQSDLNPDKLTMLSVLPDGKVKLKFLGNTTQQQS